MFYKKLLVLLVPLLPVCLTAYTQTQAIETLKHRIQIAGNDKEKLANILALCEVGYNLHPDTLITYAGRARSLAITQHNLHDEVAAMYHISVGLTTKGLIDSSLNLADHCLSFIPDKINDPILEASLLNQKGRCFMRKSKYKEAIEMGYSVVDRAEKANDILLQVKGKTMIGWAYLEMGQLNEALDWHLKAVRTASDTLVLQKYGILFANLALNYNSLGLKDSGFYYINKAIAYSRKYENLFALSNSLAIQAQLYVRNEQGALAEAPLKEVVEIRKLIGDPFYIVSDMSQLGLYYAHNGQPEKGIAICKEGIAIAEKYKIDTKLLFLYSSLAENYKAIGNDKKYAEVLEGIITLKDSVYKTNSAEALAEMQTKYDLQKKENIIIQQKLDLVSKNTLLFGSLFLAVFGVAIALLIFKNYKRKQQNIFHSMREEEQRLSQRAVITAEENERKRIAADLHDNMGAYASAISANVDDMMMDRNGTDNNVLNSMKTNAAEIMTNLRDTIWVLNKNSITITGISDRFKNYVQKLRDSYPGIQIEIKENIVTDTSLSPEGALNMLRIMQEAFHNALKHSKCKHINIEIISDKRVTVKVSDDGTGIITNDNLPGNGLENMTMRAKANAWQLLIKTLEPNGTAVELYA